MGERTTAEAAGADLTLVDLTKRFGSFTAVDQVNLTIPQGSFFALLGPSGCGKTTTLRMVAGLEEPTQGSIVLGGRDITQLQPYRRQVNTVFQNYALFPHLNVFENVAFGMRRRGIRDVRSRVEEMLSLVELEGYGSRRPGQLSGGQQQRVALARALINHPQVLLLDEPLGALDLKLRRQMQIELKRIQTEVGTTFVHVTHDQEEAMTMADTIAVMNAGVIEQMGPPAELYEAPNSTYVANFLGQSNLIGAQVSGRIGDELVLDVHGSRLTAPLSRARAREGAVWLGVRPEKVVLELAGQGAHGDARNVLPGGVVSDVSFVGVSTQYLVRMPWGQEVMAFEQNAGARPLLSVGSSVDAVCAVRHSIVLDAGQDAAAGVQRDVTDVRAAAEVGA